MNRVVAFVTGEFGEIGEAKVAESLLGLVGDGDEGDRVLLVGGGEALVEIGRVGWFLELGNKGRLHLLGLQLHPVDAREEGVALDLVHNSPKTARRILNTQSQQKYKNTKQRALFLTPL
jgi:hypothetical protein